MLGGLGILLAVLDAAHHALAFVHDSTTPLDLLRGVIASWQAGLVSLPIALDAYATADIKSAEAYLTALKRKVAQHQAASEGSLHMEVLAHLLKTLFRAFFRIVFTAILAAALAVGVRLLIAYKASNQWPPRHPIDVLIAIVAVLFAYAASLTVPVSEAA